MMRIAQCLAVVAFLAAILSGCGGGGGDSSSASAPVTFSFNPTTRTVTEGTATASLTLTRSSGASAQTVYVSTLTSEGSSNAGDYTDLSRVAYTFAAGETSRTITISIADDSTVEPDETFGVVAQQTIADPFDTYLAKATFTVTNDDSAPIQLLQNGSFEAPSIADGTLQRITPSSWAGGAALMNPNSTGNLAGNAFTWPQPVDGQQYADIGNTLASSLSQIVTVTQTDTYTFSWQDNTALNILVGFQTAPYRVTLIDSASGQVFSVDFDSYHSTGVWQGRSVSQTLTAGAYTLTFGSLNSANRTDTLIDAVSARNTP